MMFFYELCRWLGVISGMPFQWLYFSRKKYYENGKINTNKIKGPALIISNHYCPLDYISNVALFFPRKLYIITIQEVFQSAIMRFLMKFWGGVEANRETKSIKFIFESATLLKQGKLVQIFPEGHNTPDGTIKDFYPSYIMIALRGGNVPIIPVITDGSFGFTKRLHVMIGEPIYVSDYFDINNYTREDIKRANTLIREKVLALREEIERRKKANKK